ncbi:helix-turn-helix domain-containing protein [Antarcticirhabdus aurantiaca]|uniref:Helix-turn-helix transcriptional regulator n=1 Tax=Antarcticirhabdus aurantiaca TaxID=2606717 RepID=A0ACD4NN75_9HYPH|nr:helix-turn-helix transcriptional regulator [Antarcticirhabdus aurantiaca]WAJ28341.1 helix-turn-helix transcriptional regulator [Jeongeuplla avenae]
MSRPDLDPSIGTRLQNLREKRGLSISALGREIGTTYQQVRRYESGENRVDVAYSYRLAQLLDVEIHEFFRELPGLSTCSGSVLAAGAPEVAVDQRPEDRDPRTPSPSRRLSADASFSPVSTSSAGYIILSWSTLDARQHPVV